MSVTAGIDETTYLACAQALDVPLWRLDFRLREAPEAGGVVVRP